MNQPQIIPERKALTDLMKEAMDLKRRIPGKSKRIDNAFMAIYFHIDK